MITLLEVIDTSIKLQAAWSTELTKKTSVLCCLIKRLLSGSNFNYTELPLERPLLQPRRVWIPSHCLPVLPSCRLRHLSCAYFASLLGRGSKTCHGPGSLTRRQRLFTAALMQIVLLVNNGLVAEFNTGEQLSFRDVPITTALLSNDRFLMQLLGFTSIAGVVLKRQCHYSYLV